MRKYQDKGEQGCRHQRSNADRFATARKQEVEAFFNEYGHGTITEVKLMDGFGFIQYDNPDDAKDIVPCQCTPLTALYRESQLC
jgi:hypothetical protein